MTILLVSVLFSSFWTRTHARVFLKVNSFIANKEDAYIASHSTSSTSSAESIYSNDSTLVGGDFSKTCLLTPIFLIQDQNFE